jgi:hypothetical protein
MLRAVRPVGFAVLLVLSLVASASWAQQKPGSGTTREGAPAAVRCSSQQLSSCKEAAGQRCGTNQSCLTAELNQCKAMCGIGQ